MKKIKYDLSKKKYSEKMVSLNNVYYEKQRVYSKTEDKEFLEWYKDNYEVYDYQLWVISLQQYLILINAL